MSQSKEEQKPPSALSAQIRRMQRRVDALSHLLERESPESSQALPELLVELQDLLEALLRAEEERALRDEVLAIDLMSMEEPQRLFEIMRQAKQEWEATVDSLPQLICLIDAQGKIIRANRTVERWGLGRVINVRGRALHELLHPNCHARACYLASFWAEASDKLAQDLPAQIRAYDSVLGRDLHIQVQPFVASRYPDVRQGDSFAALVVQDALKESPS
jgi:PAS domain-containing protein